MTQVGHEDGALEEEYEWEVVQSYVKQYGLVRHQIESFDLFIEQTIPHVIQDNTDISVTDKDGVTSHHIHFCNVSIQPPSTKESDGFEHPCYPQSARLRGTTYCSSVMMDVVHDVVDITKDPMVLTDRRVYQEVMLCRIPVMLRSKLCVLSKSDARNEECEMDMGGYFIVNGIEKALLAQEKLRTNVPFVFPGKGKFSHFLEIRSCHELKLRSTSTLYVHITAAQPGVMPEITVTLPFITTTISVPVVFYLLRTTTRNDIKQLILGNDCSGLDMFVDDMLNKETYSYTTEEALFEWIAKEGSKEVTRDRRIKYMEHIVSSVCERGLL
jgi:DNA-directed RNA polymerase II subunit RPB2